MLFCHGAANERIDEAVIDLLAARIVSPMINVHRDLQNPLYHRFSAAVVSR